METKLAKLPRQSVELPKGSVTYRKATRYRQRAEECRAVAAQMRDQQARGSVLRTAETYECLARACEAAVEGLQRVVPAASLPA